VRVVLIAADDLGNLATHFIGKEISAHFSLSHVPWTSLSKLVKCLEFSEKGWF
jgi:hypothetical protein